MKALILVPLYVAVVLLPLGLAMVLGGEPRSLRDELASGVGLLAFSIILVEFVLSGRFKSVTNGIGMDVTMRFHQLMARTALLFALVHPFLYTGSPTGGQRPWDPSRQLTVTGDFSSLATGIAAFVLLPSFVALAIWRNRLDYRYETWRAMHGIGALLIAGLLLHHTLSAGRYSAEPALAGLWAAMTAVAAGSLLYVYLIVPFRDLARKWRVSAITRLSPRQWEVTVSPAGHPGLDYKAGQFVWLNVGHSPFSLHENPFSISSAPSGGADLSFVIKELGDFTGSLDQVRPGTRAHVDGAFGSLTVDGRSEPGIVLIAGGVGIAPLLGILRELRLTRDPRALRLIYGNRVEEQILYREELEGADVTYVLSEPPEGWAGETGLVGPDLLDRVISREEVETWLFVVCGPGAMMDAVEDHLISRGTPSGRILTERFDYD